MCMPILICLLHPVRGNLGAPHSYKCCFCSPCFWAVSFVLHWGFLSSDPVQILLALRTESLGIDVTDTRVGLVYVHFWGPRRRKWTQERGVVRLTYICKASALLTNGLLCCLQNMGDFWGPSCSVRALINNKCLSPPAWTSYTFICANTSQHHRAPVETRNNTLLRPGPQAVASSGDFPMAWLLYSF